MNDEQISNLIQQHGDHYRASDRLRAAVQTQLTLHQVTQLPQAAARERRPFGVWLGRVAQHLFGPHVAGGANVLRLGLAFGLGVVMTLFLVLGPLHPEFSSTTSNTVATELVSLHVHSMGAGPLFQVASSDRHTVKPWFQGKLDYAPPVADLQDQGFELLGGRIDRVQGHETAVLTYRMRNHILSAYVMPVDRVMAESQLQHRGFNLLHWSSRAMEVWVISDIDAAELHRFASAWRLQFPATKS